MGNKDQREAKHHVGGDRAANSAETLSGYVAGSVFPRHSILDCIDESYSRIEVST